MFKAATNLNNKLYRSYPRIGIIVLEFLMLTVGETGGKDFHVAHKSAEVELLVNATIKAAFEYQGSNTLPLYLVT